MKFKHDISNNKSGFNLPSSYFEDFDKRILDVVSSSEKNVSSAFPSKSGFTTPDSYFDSVEKSILEKTTQQHQPKVFKMWYHQLAKVAAIILIIITGYGILTVDKKLTSAEDGFANLSETDIENYIEQYIYPYSEMRNIYITKDNFELADNQLENLNQEVILDYLDHELDDLDLLEK